MLGGLKRREAAASRLVHPIINDPGTIEPDPRSKKKKTKFMLDDEPLPAITNTKPNDGDKKKSSAKKHAQKESEMVGSKEHRRAMRKRWIEDISEPSSSGQRQYLCLVFTRSIAPVVGDMDDARHVVMWFRQTGFVGVRPENDRDVFRPFVIRDLVLDFFTEETFDSVEEAAKEHDRHHKKLGLRYRRNFIKKLGPPGHYGRKAFGFNESASTKYFVARSKPEFVRHNVRLMRGLCLRLSHQLFSPTLPVVEPESESARVEECWMAIRQLLKLEANWSLGRLRSFVAVGSLVDALGDCWRIGDALLRKELIGLPSMEEWRKSESLKWKQNKLAQDLAGLGTWADHPSANDAPAIDDEATKQTMDDLFSKSAYEKFKRKVSQIALKDRIAWSVSIVNRAVSMYDKIVATKKMSKRALTRFDWIWRPLRVEAICRFQLLSLESLPTNNVRAAMRDMVQTLHERETHPMFAESSNFWLLLAEVSMVSDINKLKLSQRLIAKSLEKDPQNSRANLALGLSEHFLTMVQARTLQQTMQSVSQRTTQDDNDDFDDDEEARATPDDGLRSDLNVPQIVLQAIKADPDNISLWLALESLLFVDDTEGGGAFEETNDKRRMCLMRLLRMQPTLTGACLERVRLYWRLSSLAFDKVKASERDPKAEEEVLVDFVWTLVDVMESLTQKEYINYTSFFSDVSIPLWEHLVAALARLPPLAIVFTSKRRSLWCRRFFPDALGFFQDPFAFHKDERVRFNRKRKITADSCRPDEYLLGLSAFVAGRCDVSPEFYAEVTRGFGPNFVDVDCVEKAKRRCNEVHR